MILNLFHVPVGGLFKVPDRVVSSILYSSLQMDAASHQNDEDKPHLFLRLLPKSLSKHKTLCVC